MRLTRHVADEIEQAARESLPEECCGIVLAESCEPALGVRILRARNVESRKPGCRYVLDHRVHIRAIEEELRSEARIVGYFHSHTAGSAEPSRVDARLAVPGVMYVVASLAGPPELRAWRWTGDRFEEEAVSVEESAHEKNSARCRAQV